MKTTVALDLKEIGEIVAKHLRAKGYKLAGPFNLKVNEKVQLTFELEN